MLFARHAIHRVQPALYGRYDVEHEKEVKGAAQEDKEMKDLMVAKAGIVPPRPLDCIEDAADGIEQSAAQEPEKTGGGEKPIQGNQNNCGNPAHKEVNRGGKPAGGRDPDQGEDKSGQCKPPNNAEHGPAPGAIIPKDNQADGRIGSSDEKINGGMVKFAQSYAAFDRSIDAVIEGAGGVEPNHTQTIDGEGSNVPHSGIQEYGADEQQQSP